MILFQRTNHDAYIRRGVQFCFDVCREDDSLLTKTYYVKTIRKL